MRIGIVGMGWVGSSVAQSILHAGVARELLLNDIQEALAEGEAMDLSHGAPFVPAVRVRAAAVEEMRDADAVVVAAGRGGGAGESRLALLRDNAAIVRSIGEHLRGHRGLIVVVTNPVDVLTQIMAEASGLPHSRVIGTGTLLDTARLRQVVGETLDLEPRSIHAQVVGEHGDSEVALFSSATVGGLPLRRWPGWDREREPAIATRVRTAAYEIIRRKGATNHAIGMVTASLLKWALRDERRVLTVSRVQDGTAGVEGVATSLPAVLCRQGAVQVVEPQMDEGERDALARSCEVLREARRALDG
ncbi:MAG TPA: L-lactate dehydrogenase [Sandaracinaceae bacterium LLY-WYZ-13_1]|nr:L-lactate dehydrogenase [Sandaracinaceae bacterium LLY-WYZ-13_1]